MKTTTPVEIRWMIRRDMQRVCEIEYESQDFPWFEEDFIHCLRQRNCIGMVAESRGKIVGFMLYELHRSRLELLALAVAKESRQQSVGRQMIQKLASKLSQARRTELVALVSEANYDGQMFYKALGFKATMVIRGHFEVNREDAYRMVFRLKRSANG